MGQQGAYKLSDAKPLGAYSLDDAKASQPDPEPEGGVSHFASEFWKRANPMTWAEGLVEAAKHPVDTAVNMVRADPKFLDDAKDAAGKGDYLTAGRKVLSYLSMGLGHELDAQADMGAKGDLSGMGGAMAGTATQFLAPEVAARGLAAVPSMAMKPANPAVADAIAAGKRAGVPMSAATATDNAAVGALQHITDRSVGGATIAGKSAQREAQGLATMGEQLAAKGHPLPVTAEQAGVSTARAIDANVADHAQTADAAYGRLRAIEAKRPIPVDLAAAKAAIEPMYRTLATGADIAPQYTKSVESVSKAAYILQGPDIADASVADSALSDLKALQRDAKGTPGAAAANLAVDKVHQAVLSAVTKAGPDALQALNEGRAATTAKYVAQDVLDSLKDEPVRTIQGLTRADDASIEALRDIGKQAPQVLPQIGRSVLDGMLGEAKEAKAFAHADKLYADWNKLGAETKSLLFRDPAYIKSLDDFFLLGKQMAKNANSSGSAHTIAIASQGGTIMRALMTGNLQELGYGLASIGATGGISAFLHSTAGVKLLTGGMRLPPSPAAQAAWLAKVRAYGVAQGWAQDSQPAGAGR